MQYYNYSEIIERILTDNGISNAVIKTTLQSNCLLGERTLYIHVNFPKSTKTIRYNADKYPKALKSGWPYYCAWYQGKTLDKSRLNFNGLALSITENDYLNNRISGHISLIGNITYYRSRNAMRLAETLKGLWFKEKTEITDNNFIEQITPYLVEVCQLYKENLE